MKTHQTSNNYFSLCVKLKCKHIISLLFLDYRFLPSSFKSKTHESN